LTTPAGSAYRERLRTSVLIGLCCFAIYNANLRSITAGDTYPARYLPFAIVQYHTIFLEPVARVAGQGRGEGAFWLLHRPDGHILSLYPVVVPVVIAPLYVPAVAYLHLRGWTDARLDHVAKVMEKLTASLLSALSASLLYLLLRRRTTASTALLLTVAYALGTTTWVISSQALWQHGMAELLVIGALLMLTGPCTAARVIVAGMLLGLIAGNRPPDVVIAAALGTYGLFWAGRRLAPLLAAAALPLLLILFYNLRNGGNVAGGYGVNGNAQFFDHSLPLGIAGLLVSPTRGLLLFSPFLLFLVLAWLHRPTDRDELRLTWAMVAAVVIQILLYAKADWRSGLSWGPRFMTDLLPLLIWMLVPVVTALRGAGRMAFLLAVGVAITFEAIGAFSYSGWLDNPIYAADPNQQHQDMRPAWKWRNCPIVTAMRSGLAPPDLTANMRGSFDAIQSGGRTISSIAAGQQVVATGWALAGSATPWQVALSVDGRTSAASRTFSDRPDVRATLHETSPAGWRIELDTSALAPDRHRLTAMVWAYEKGEGQYLDERELIVIAAAGADADLAQSSVTAAARLREHQQSAGFWLTAYTNEMRFHDARPEMNTFLTALLVDLLSPLAASSGLEDTLRRARTHLTSQIESSGLVRYHGLPNGARIGTLGCVITPDTDDTALVWRLAPGSDRSRLAAALSTIDRYRTPEGLYRSWLAPRAAYQCLDPGRDPNPADIVIQAHVLLLLSEIQPAAGRALCNALRPVVDENRVWVYYRKAPLIPMLREADLRRAGCELKLPESRMRTDIPEQQIWVSVLRLLTDATNPPDPVRLRAVLRELSRDDFALIRTNPPLLYHNDLTATVSRYYWSEDAGYAFWLRLYDHYERLGHPHNAG
jgi:hypothetical protein